ncbi:DUF4185 domain-containing protein [Brachybacterium sacelli]|uniref:DUF4185 domain-containing protein n=1 Tax=Brachybacterium sacelli TaxID=173364 RepID=A0ABS4WZJ8_9MICO|nr:DUF4185 domain-containing protein [Brachybacterium sacelli]MBP2381635.1 hypothetical protein [Brachybacterium sacelli]
MLSRSTFLRGSGALAGVGALTAACGVSDASGTDPDADSEDACPRVTRMAAITGPGVTTRFRMEATDLGAPAVTPDGRILFVFGDTFEEAKVGSGFWRSPVGLFADPEVPLDDGITWTTAVGGETAEQLVPYEHDEDPVSTILPGDVLTVDGIMYLWMMVNHGFGNVAGTEIWTSADSGETWERTAEMFPGDHAGGLMQQCTWCAHPTDGYVYVLTTGFQRDKGVLLSRVRAESILDPAAYETWSGADSWGGEPVTVVGGEIGEMCLRMVEDQWVLTYFDSGNYRVDIRAADSPIALADAAAGTLLHGGEWGQEADDVVAQLYGPYIVPGSTLEVMHLVCSQWHTGPDWPYHVEQFRIEDPLGRGCGE